MILYKKGRFFILFSLIALDVIKGPLNIGDVLKYVGVNKEKKIRIEATSIVDNDSYRAFDILKSIEINDNIIMLTEKGRAFVEYLNELGYIVIEASTRELSKSVS